MLAGLRLYGCVWMRALGAVQKGRARSVARYAVSGKAAAFVEGGQSMGSPGRPVGWRGTWGVARLPP